MWLGDTDTGVANRAVGGGCTVNDLIDDESTWADHDSFVRHVTAVARTLQGDDVAQRHARAGALTRAAAASADRPDRAHRVRAALRRHRRVAARLGAGAVGSVRAPAGRVAARQRRAGHALVHQGSSATSR